MRAPGPPPSPRRRPSARCAKRPKRGCGPLALALTLTLAHTRALALNRTRAHALTRTLTLTQVRRSTDEVLQADFVDAINTFNAGRRRLPSMDALLPGLAPVKPSWWPGEKN